MQFVNLPHKKNDDKIDIVGQLNQNTILIQTSNGWTICEIGATTDQQLIDDICQAIKLARNEGYRQAFDDMRAFFFNDSRV